MYNIIRRWAACLLAASLFAAFTLPASAASSSEAPSSAAGNGAELITTDVAESVNSPAPISAGYLHSGVIRADGSLWMAGANGYGQLGNGQAGSEPQETSSMAEGEEPAEDAADSIDYIRVMDNIKAVYAGYLNTFAIDGDDTLWVWGWNQGGQLGLGDKSTRTKPVPLLNDVLMAAPGDYHSAAVTRDGTLWTWGWNVSGELGNGSQQDLYAPKEVLEDVRQVAVGLKHTMAVKNDNTLWACGDNTYGQLADGGTEMQTSFVQVMKNVKSVSATAFGSLIIKTDGTLWACGYNGSGELGNGTFEDIPEPVQILKDVEMTAASREFAAAIDKKGVLYAWGLNNYGQYGGETSTTPMEMDKDVSFVSAGGGHILYLKENAVYACGNNERGQFGLGNTNNAATPLNVFDNVAVTPETVRSPMANSGPAVLTAAIIVAVLALFAFLITRTLRGKNGGSGKKPPQPGAGAPKPEATPEQAVAKLSDAELLRMAEAMNAAAAGEEEPKE